jgi:hypothetical protein
MPVQIIVRMCTEERVVTEYWHGINAQLDLDIYVLDHMDTEAVEVRRERARETTSLRRPPSTLLTPLCCLPRSDPCPIKSNPPR